MNTNPKVTKIALPAAGGAFTPIPMTIVAGKVDVMEDPSLNGGVAQGLTGFYTDTQPGSSSAAGPFPNQGPQQVWLPNTAGQQGGAYQPIVFGGTDGRVHGGEGDYVGADGTIILRLTSNSATPTGVIMREWA